MLCISCGAKLDTSPVFPGATIQCACGTENVVLPPATPHTGDATPYRDPASMPDSVSRTSEAGLLTCPFCGAPCTAEARACSHCDVQLAAVRCPQCFALHFTGARFCSRCRTELHPEPLLDASDAPCPRCSKPLGSTHEGGVFECTACGGLFVDHTAFAALCAEKEAEAKPYASHAPLPSTRIAEVEVHYLKCPVCQAVMNRLNFGRRSGTIVDVCGLHGTWFDAGELTRVLEWIASGAYAEERIREQAEHAAREREKTRAHSHGDVTLPNVQPSVIWPHAGSVLERTADSVLALLDEFLRIR